MQKKRKGRLRRGVSCAVDPLGPGADGAERKGRARTQPDLVFCIPSTLSNPPTFVFLVSPLLPNRRSPARSPSHPRPTLRPPETLTSSPRLLSLIPARHSFRLTPASGPYRPLRSTPAGEDRPFVGGQGNVLLKRCVEAGGGAGPQGQSLRCSSHVAECGSDMLGSVLR